MFKHILVPTDGSELSMTAVQHAIQFAREAGAKITFFFAKPDYPVAFYGEGALIDPTSPEKFASMADAQSNALLATASTLANEAGVACDTRSTVNDVTYLAIIEAAQDAECDLIFMASHGRRGISGLLLGSETQRVLTHSSIPVLVWR